MLKFVGKKNDFKRFIKFVKSVFGKNPTIKELCGGMTHNANL